MEALCPETQAAVQILAAAYERVRKRDPLGEPTARGWLAGRPLAAIGVMREISERKRAEREAWEYARRLEDATALKDLFADILRHDLTGPAATVQLSIESLLRREPDPQSYRRILQTARRSCAKLSTFSGCTASSSQCGW